MAVRGRNPPYLFLTVLALSVIKKNKKNMNMIVLNTKTMESPQVDNVGYNYLLAVSSDSLHVINQERTKIVETIVNGSSNEAILGAFTTEDDFLDAINLIKDCLLDGLNPLVVFNLHL